ncbi:hypothetical protein HPB50_000109 [Hyalomma asiaticum]|uniref:Uncharacterized protein n=1 Tax=Hyalomma asiaticum TaxID=266040 RepID=A0ACB7STM2_HYAAI|nr:hypothetical protein HPB50_000109 [Hyalomma asiaticum]
MKKKNKKERCLVATMGHYICKETMDPRTGLTPTEIRLIKKTWRSFCDSNRDYGVLILQAFFTKQPDTVHLFPHFRGKPARSLPEDLDFRMHACAFGCQLTAMVENCDDVELLEALVRKNAQAHRKHLGVTPTHFRVMTKAIMDVLQAKISKLMKRDVVSAWEKLFTFIVTVTAIVFESSIVASDVKKKSEDDVGIARAPSKVLSQQKSKVLSAPSLASTRSPYIKKSQGSSSKSCLAKSQQPYAQITTAVVPYEQHSENCAPQEGTSASSATGKMPKSKSSLKEQLRAMGKII